MSKKRMIDTRFWNDTFISNLNPLEKLLFIYFLTNEHTSISGIYELPLKIAAVETGIDPSMFAKMLPDFKERITYIEGWVVVKNFAKHQSKNPSVQKGIDSDLQSVPPHIKAKIDRLYTESVSVYTESPVLKNNTKNKNNTNTKAIAKITAIKIDKRDPQITQLISVFESQVGKVSRDQSMVAAELIKQHGLERALLGVEAVVRSRGQEFAPNIGSLEDLRDKWIKLENFFRRKSKSNLEVIS